MNVSNIKSSSWQLISFYTVGTGYEREIAKLERSLEQFKIPFKFYQYKPVGSWRQNLNFKSECIRDALDEFKPKDIVFVDADAIVRKYPILFDKLSSLNTHHVAAHYHSYRETSKMGGSLLSGTLWFKNDDTARMLIQKWHLIGLEHPNIRHQHCLNLAINELNKKEKKINVYRMPREYTYIFDYKGERKCDPIIEHFQASRRLRRQVGRGQALLNSNFKYLNQASKGARRLTLRERRGLGGANIKRITTKDLRMKRRVGK